MKKEYNKQKGFTLIETFVAITILVITVLGPMTLLSRALQDARYIKDEITATFLAQEGVELMLDNRNNGNGSEIRSGGGLLFSCSPFYLNSLNPINGYHCPSVPGDVATVFSRSVTVDDLGDSQYKITSIVSRNNFPSKNVVSSSIIFK